MSTLQITIMSIVIAVLLVQYYRAATKARSLLSANTNMKNTTDCLESTLRQLRKSHQCDINAMRHQHAKQEEAMRSMRHTLNGHQTIKCITFSTRTAGLRRYTVGHNVSRITFKRDDNELSITCFKDNGASSSTIFKMADITGSIHVDRAD